MAIRDRFARTAQAAEPPASEVVAEDPLTLAEAGVCEAQGKLDAHRATRQARLDELRELHARRGELLADDDIDGALETDRPISRAELAIQALDRHDGDLTAGLMMAQRRLQRARAEALRPHLDAGYRQLAGAAEALIQAITDARSVELEAVRLGVLREPWIPVAAGINGQLLHSWANWGRNGNNAADEWARATLERHEQARLARFVLPENAP